MGTHYKTVGGGSAAGVGNDFASFLGQGLNTGSFGGGTSMGQAGATNPWGQTHGIGGVLNDILSGGAGNLGGSLAHLLQTQQSNDIGALRSRFGVGGGTAFGSPAAYAESNYRSQVAPQIATQVGGLQMSALAQLLPQFANLANIGIPHAETVGVQNPWVQAAQIAAPIAGSIFGMNANPFGSIGGAGGSGFNPAPMNQNFGSMFGGPTGLNGWQPNFRG